MFYSLLLILLSTIGQSTLVMYLPAFSEIGTSLNLQPSQVSQSVTLFMLAFAFGQFILGGLSDTFRPKSVLYTSFAIYIVGIALVLFSSNPTYFFLARILQGLASGGILATSRGMVNRSYHGQKLVSMLTITTIAASVSGAASPVIGGFIVHYGSWLYIFAFLGVYSVLLFLATLLMPSPNYQNSHSLPMSWAQRKLHLITNTTFTFPALSASFVFAISVAYYTVAPYIFQTMLGMSAAHFGLLSLATSGSYILSAFVNIVGIGREKTRMICGYVCILVGAVAILGMASLNTIHITYLLVALMLIMFGMGLTFTLNMSSAVKGFKHVAGSAGALMGVFQIGIGTIGSYFISYFVGPNAVLVFAYFTLTFCFISVFFSCCKNKTTVCSAQAI